MAPTTRTRIRALRFVPILSILACLAGVERGPAPGPEQAHREAWQRLGQLSCFRFRLRYRTDTPVDIRAELSGAWNEHDRESWSGFRWHGGERQTVTLVGSGDAQHERVQGRWHRTDRGLETRILEQVQQVVRDREMVLLDSTRAEYRYRFEPRLPVLDPGRVKRFTGVLRVQRSSGLPLAISCRDESGSSQWEVAFDRFDRAGQIRVPFVPKATLVITPERRVGRRELGRAIGALRTRLDALGLSHRLSWHWCRLVLQLEQDMASSQLGLLLSVGAVEVWAAKRSGLDGREANALFVGGDAAFPVVPLRRVAGHGDFSARAEADLFPGPRLVLTAAGGSWARLAGEDVSLLVLLVDGAAFDAAGVPGGRTLEFSGPGSRETIRTLAALGSGPALPVGFRIVSVR